MSELNKRDHDHDRSGRAPPRKDNVPPLYGNSRDEGDARRDREKLREVASKLREKSQL